METKDLQRVLEVAPYFTFDETITSVFEIPTGHINRTYHLQTEAPRSYILQKVNTVIFKDTEGLMNNIALVTEHLQKKADRCRQGCRPRGAAAHSHEGR